jgi:hypothetical protein
MSTTRPAGFGLMFLGACFVSGFGCSSSSSGATAPDGGGSATAGAGGSTTHAATTTSTTSSGGAGGNGTGGAGTGGAGGSGGVAPGGSKLGAGCNATAECGTGLTCLKSSDNISAQAPGGPGNGLCTVDCTTNQAICGPLGGICIAVDASADAGVTRAFCFESCAIGPNPPAAPVPKCHSRDEVVCEPVNNAETIFACVPLCVTDADCGTRKCEAASGLCVETPFPGKTVGSGCTVTLGVSNNECAGGLCLPITAIPDGGTTTPGICTALCNLGAQEACGFRLGALDAGPPQGACVLPWGDTGYNSGDLGLCLQLCDNSNDCSYRSPNWTCRTDIALTGTGHSVCLVPLPD